MDLPIADPEATFETYADVVATAVDDTDEPVVVGHSLAGQTIPLVAERRPVAGLVYLCALVPIPSLSFREQLQAEPDTLLPEYEAGLSERDALGRRHWIDERIARETLFADCDVEAVREAFRQLRPQSSTPHGVVCPLERHPRVDTVYVVCTEDRIVNPVRGREVAQGRLGAEVVELPGSHSPFLSRPAHLAQLLHDRWAGDPRT